MTIIGPSVVISGELTSDEDLRIDGHVHGDVRLRDATLTIAKEARIDADVRASRIVVHGYVRGSLSASERIELTATAKVKGHVSANQVVVVDGADFNGRIDMDQRTIAARVAQFKAAQASSR